MPSVAERTLPAAILNSVANLQLSQSAMENASVVNEAKPYCTGSTPENTHLEFGTKAVHAGQDPTQWNSLAVIPPISLSTTFKQYVPGEHAGGYCYSRDDNPTRKCLEECIASLEGAKYAMCFASGMAATTTVAFLLNSGDHVVCGDEVYGGTNSFFRTCASRMGIECSFVDARDPQLVAKAIKPNTKMVWLETPTNPTLKLADIEAITKIVSGHKGVFTVIDSTFMSPFFQRPLSLGADIVLHSLTKYMNGHTDVVMGVLATSDKDFYERLSYLQCSLGTVPSPMDCFLVNRGLKTLHLRMERHMTNGLEIARFLEKHPQVEKVIHPGLPSHPQHELAKRQCSGFSGMFAFYLKGGLKESQVFLRNLKIFTLADSLGGVESLVNLSALMTHSSVPAEQREKSGITDNLIRVSVGLEGSSDLIRDLDQALKATLKN